VARFKVTGVRDVLRPRGVAGLWRSRPPIWALLVLAQTVTLLHSPTAAAATALVARARAQGGGPLLVLTRGITATAPQPFGPGGLHVEALDDELPLLVAGLPTDPAPKAPAGPGRFHGRDVAVLLGGSALVLVIVAWFVAVRERAVCSAPCEGVPTRFGDALYWMANRLLGGDPDGLGVTSVFGRTVGVLVTVYGLYVLVTIVGAVVRQRIDDDQRSAADRVVTYVRRRGLVTGTYPLTEPHASGELDVGYGQLLHWETAATARVLRPSCCTAARARVPIGRGPACSTPPRTGSSWSTSGGADAVPRTRRTPTSRSTPTPPIISSPTWNGSGRT
jgi:hypothetical protein